MENDAETPNEPPEASEPAYIVVDSQVTFSRRNIGSKSSAVAYHAALGKFYQLGAEEYRIVSLLDGKHTLSEILQTLADDGVEWEPKEVAEFISKLVSTRLAHPVARAEEEPPNPSDQDGKPTEERSTLSRDALMRVLKMMSLVISQRFPLLQGDAIASRLERRVGAIFSAFGMIVWCGLVASGMIIVSAHGSEFSSELRRMFEPGIWLVLLVMWVLSKVAHELGHAVAARHHGVRVGKIGIMFFLFAPLAYVDVTGAWNLKSRWRRVQIALAGVYVELILASLAAWVWWLLPNGMPRHLAAQLFIVAGPATLLVNANPLLRLDGYYVLSDLTEIPNLRMHGRRQLLALLERLLLRIKPPRPLLSGWRRIFATVHAILSVMFQVVWMGGLVIGISMWAKGLGVVIAVAAAILWAVLPLSRWVYKIWMMEPGRRLFLNRKRRRLISYGCLVCFWSYHLLADSSPLARRVPVVVQFHQEQIARASADAFVEAVYVKRGQRVDSGTLLLELKDPDLLLKRDQKDGELRIAELRAIQYRRQGELSRSAAETGNAQSLRRQLAELNEQIAGLQVVSERAGIVQGPKLDSALGRFVERGEELLRISDPQEKELLASVAESDMQAYQAAAAHGEPATIRLRGGTRFQAVPAPLRPRARKSLPHPALSATAGGPLPVEPSTEGTEEGVQLIEPQLRSRTTLDPITSAELHAGQIGTMTIEDNRTLVTRLIAWGQRN